jgi:hypothetical protein
MLPKRTEAINLLVPVALSASHVAYSTLRMEPQYMIIGQAAGVAARMAIQAQSPLQDINVKQLADTLRKQGAVFEYRPVPLLPVWTGPAAKGHVSLRRGQLWYAAAAYLSAAGSSDYFTHTPIRAFHERPARATVCCQELRR